MAESDLEKIEQCVALISADDTLKNEELIREIENSKYASQLSPIIESNDEIKHYNFELDTKYYKSSITLSCLNNTSAIKEILNKNLQVLFILFDSKKENYFERFNSLLEKIPNQKDLLIKLLICRLVDDNSLRNQIIGWCLDNDFELIELDEVDDEKEFKNPTGIDRIIEALNSYSWPLMSLKDETNHNFGKNESNLDDEINKLTSECNLADELVNDDDSNFEKLFTKFHEFKEKAENLKGEERYQYAEKISLAFFKSLTDDI